MKTNEFGARIGMRKRWYENINVLGESQLLGLDYSDGEGPHDLHLIFPDNNNLEIYAAPNNGPFKTSNQIRYFEQKSLRGNYWLTGKNIVIGFHSTDIFRINDGCDPETGLMPLEKRFRKNFF